MTKEEKAVIIEDLTQKFKDNMHFYITDTGGLSVKEVNEFRRKCFEKGIEYKVVKNTLIKKALENLEADFSPLYDNKVLKGFSGIMFSKENAKEPANILKNHKKKDKDGNPKLKAASIDFNLFIGSENLEMLTTLKSKEELVGDIISLLQSPAKNVIGALQSGKHILGGLMKTLQDRSL
jgi:large subunit ribosomal protein L10